MPAPGDVAGSGLVPQRALARACSLSDCYLLPAAGEVVG